MHLKIERPDALHRMLASGEIVLALTDAPYDRGYFLSEPYCTDRLVPVFAPGYRKRRTFSLGDYIRCGGKFVLDETMWGAQSPLRRSCSSISVFSAFRARKSRDLTVPGEQSIVAAISSTDISS